MDRAPTAPSRWRRRDRRSRRRDARGWYPRSFLAALSLPATWWMLLFLALPLFTVLAVAFGGVDPLFGSPLPVWDPRDWDATVMGETLRQLVRPEGAFFAPAVRTIAFTAIATFLCLVIGYPVAYTVARHAGRRKGLLLGALLAPFFISYLMRMLAWINLLRDDGLVNRVLEIVPFAEPQQWLGGRPITVILGLVYGYVPYLILPVFATLDAIDGSILDEARDLGAGPSDVFWRVTWPLSRPAVLAGVLIVALPMTGDYYTADLLSGSPGTTVLANQIDFLVHARNAGPTIGATLICLLGLALVVPMVWYLRSVGTMAAERDARLA